MKILEITKYKFYKIQNLENNFLNKKMKNFSLYIDIYNIYKY
jgi:hypothetical protein|nr:MAG TPA: hypothetical protein [Caudoviricetes sp.]